MTAKICRIIAVPAIGANPRYTFRYPESIKQSTNISTVAPVTTSATGQVYKEPWQSLFDPVQDAGKYVYWFPQNHADYKLDQLADLFLQEVMKRIPILSNEEKSPPIHIAAHGTGGLVVKRALVRAYLHTELPTHRVSMCCYSVAFFGVPHQGSETLCDDGYYEKGSRRAQLGPKMKFIREGRDSKPLRDLNCDFVSYSNQLCKVWSFAEELSAGTPDEVVPSKSAMISCTDRDWLFHCHAESFVQVRSNHDQLCCFGEDEKSSAFVDYINGLHILIMEQVFRIEITNIENRTIHGIPAGMRTCSVPLQIFLRTGLPRYRDNTSLPTAPSQISPNLKPEKNVQAAGKQNDSEHYLRNGQDATSHNYNEQDEHTSEPSEFQLDPPSLLPANIMSEFSRRTNPSHGFPIGALRSPGTRNDPSSMRRTASSNLPNEECNSLPVPLSRASFTKPFEGLHLRTSGMKRLTKRGTQMFKQALSRTINQNMSGSAQDILEPQDGISVPPSPAFKPILDNTSALSDRRSIPFTPFVWIHVPCNNMTWVKEVFQALKGRFDAQMADKLSCGLLHNEIWLSKQHKPSHGRHHGRFMKPTCQFYMPNAEVEDQFNPGVAHLPDLTGPQLAVYLPYLHWDFAKSLKIRNALIEAKSAERVVTPPGYVLKDMSQRQRLLWHCLDSGDLSLHPRRSLDQYGYPALKDTSRRDQDQILNKMTDVDLLIDVLRKIAPPEEQDKQPQKAQSMVATLQAPESTSRRILKKQEVNKCVLMVDQLWCWVVSEDTIVTFFSNRDNSIDQDVEAADLEAEIRSTLNIPVYRHRCRNSFDFAALVVYKSVTVLLDCLDVFRVFEDWISELNNKTIESFEAFSKECAAHRNSISPSQHQDSSIEFNRYIELLDVADELSMLERLLLDQNHVVTNMKAEFQRTECPVSSHAIETLEETLRKIEEYYHQINHMQEACNKMQIDYNALHDMKQKQANLEEAIAARCSQEEAEKQSRTLMVFTVVTVLFSPLTFFTGLFSMNLREWDNNHPTTKVVAIYTSTLSFAVIAIALIFIVRRVRGFIRNIPRHFAAVFGLPGANKEKMEKLRNLSPSQSKNQVAPWWNLNRRYGNRQSSYNDEV